MKAKMKLSDLLYLTFGARDSKCLDDVDLLAYSENQLSTSRRVRLESHLVGCDDCRQVLISIGEFSIGEETVEKGLPISEAEAADQTNKVLGYIRNDERIRANPALKNRSERGFQISYPKLATVGLVLCAIVIAAGFFLSRQSPVDAGMEALKLGLKDQRRTEARISGGLGYSRYAGVTRGENPNDDNLHFDRALGKLRSAAAENAPVNERLALARVYLARGTAPDIERAFTILNQLSARGIDSPELLNDMGVAYMQRGDYSKASDFFLRSLSKAPNYEEALFNKALAEQRDHRNDDAKRDWLQFINQTSDDKWKTEATDHLKALQ